MARSPENIGERLPGAGSVISVKGGMEMLPILN